jgi:Domain of unknown function (DUF4442)
MNTSQKSFFALVANPFKFRLFLFYKLPAAFFSGIRLRYIKEDKCITSVSLKWLTQNPFRSIYFASLAMAAEMSTGLLAMSNVYKRKPAISMLVTKMEANYFKKATGTILFECTQGNEITLAIDEAAATGNSKVVIARSIGSNSSGDIVAEFLFTWSFKAKTSGRP